MALTMDKLFDPKAHTNGKDISCSTRWHPEAFRKAYCKLQAQDTLVPDIGPFERVCHRLLVGFSVLVYVPGNCMNAAANYAQERLAGIEWQEFGKYPTNQGGGSITIHDIWGSASNNLVDRIFRWFSGEGGKQPGAIFHNLEMLSDQQGAVHSDPAALTALFALTEATRSGVVLGLADRSAGELPGAISRIFAETIWLDEIDFKSFMAIIPRALGEQLAVRGTLGAGIAWQIASRLRGVDPIRAVRIMTNAADFTVGQSITDRLNSILKTIWQATRAVSFKEPEGAFHGELTGFEANMKENLEHQVISPLKNWATMADPTLDQEKCESILQRLPSGLVLHGPAGVGKTHIVLWLAQRIGLPYRVIDANDIKDPLYGLAEKNVHRLFHEARQAAPCILVFDDAEDLFPDRKTAKSSSLASVERSIVNATLQELEGLEGRPAGVLVVLTTNRYEDVDSAVKSKLDTHVPVPYPLSEDQIGEIVDHWAESFDLDLEPDMRSCLIDRFYAPVDATKFKGDCKTAKGRREASEGLFSARDIRNAMRRLLLTEVAIRQKYKPTEEDFNRMSSYYGLWPHDQADFNPS